MFNNGLSTNKIPTLWRQAGRVAILKTGKDPANSKSFRSIALLCHTYKLYEISSKSSGLSVDQHLIPEEAGLRPGKSCTSQLLNLAQFIEDGCEKGSIGDLSAAYDTVNHRILVQKFSSSSSVRRHVVFGLPLFLFPSSVQVSAVFAGRSLFIL